MVMTTAKVLGPREGMTGSLGSIGVRFMIGGDASGGGFALRRLFSRFDAGHGSPPRNSGASRGPRIGPAGAGSDHMFSIITCPKPEHDTWVAPSMRRAKS